MLDIVDSTTNVLIFRRGGRLYPALTADRLRAVRIETGKEP
ncbi:MAG: hypothetical protein ACE10G_12875 [Gemmatimonadales bacterium]